MAKNYETFAKRQREKARQDKARRKRERRQERREEKRQPTSDRLGEEQAES